MHLFLMSCSWYQGVLQTPVLFPRSPAPGTAAAARSRSPSPTRNNNSSTNGNQSQSVKTKLQLVDLAGSECVGKNRTRIVTRMISCSDWYLITRYRSLVPRFLFPQEIWENDFHSYAPYCRSEKGSGICQARGQRSGREIKCMFWFIRPAK